ncbi:hypothetical protein ACWMS0_002628, partial [Salmonella enterica subsp. enterica]
ICGITNNTRARFIPAGAGNTAVSFSHASQMSVYPRWPGNTAVSDGLSQAMPVYPRWRGEHCHHGR